MSIAAYMTQALSASRLSARSMGSRHLTTIWEYLQILCILCYRCYINSESLQNILT